MVKSVFTVCAMASVHYRAVAIRFGVVRLIVHAQECYTLGGPGGMLAAMRLLLRPLLVQYDASQRQDDRV